MREPDLWPPPLTTPTSHSDGAKLLHMSEPATPPVASPKDHGPGKAFERCTSGRPQGLAVQMRLARTTHRVRARISRSRTGDQSTRYCRSYPSLYSASVW